MRISRAQVRQAQTRDVPARVRQWNQRSFGRGTGMNGVVLAQDQAVDTAVFGVRSGRDGESGVEQVLDLFISTLLSVTQSEYAVVTG